MKTTANEVFESNNWIITKVIQGRDNIVRIDAKTRFFKADENNFYSEWISLNYANRLAMVNYGKKVNEFNCYKY